MAAIEIEALRKSYAGGPETLKGIDLSVEPGAMCVLVGPSGCGKSTLLRCVAGLETVTSGEIRIGGRAVNDLEPAERDIAMVFQNYALYPHMSVRGNLEYGLRNRRTPPVEIEARVAEAARILGIAELLDRKPRTLSGGQRQRVAMGRAIVRKPVAFLFDEPLSNLDAKLRNQMRVEIRKLQRSLATTSIYVTHDQLEAMTLADLLVVMNAGRIEQIGAPAEVYDRPETLFAAGFMGSPAMNLIPVAELRAAGAALPEALPAGCATVGVRPEHVAPGAAGPGIALDLDLDAVELAGAESFLHLRHPRLSERLIVRAAPGAVPARSVLLPLDRLHGFDAAGKRVAFG